MDIKYIRGACSTSKWDRKSNETPLYERCGMGMTVNGLDCGVVILVKHSILRWFGNSENEFVENV